MLQFIYQVQITLYWCPHHMPDHGLQQQRGQMDQHCVRFIPGQCCRGADNRLALGHRGSCSRGWECLWVSVTVHVFLLSAVECTLGNLELANFIWRSVTVFSASNFFDWSIQEYPTPSLNCSFCLHEHILWQIWISASSEASLTIYISPFCCLTF